jgi:diguanylate cyclase (GGDEF)-like protein
MGWVVRILLWLALVPAALLGPSRVAAQAGAVGRPVAVCVRQGGGDAAAMLRAPRDLDCRTPQRRFGAGDFLVVSHPLVVRGPVRVRSGSVWQGGATLWARYADGAVLRLPTDDRGASHRLQLGAVFEWALPARAAPLTRLLWEVKGAANTRDIVRDPRIATPAESARSNTLLAAFYAGFAGLCLALLIYNLALWGALRQRFQLCYCAMVAALLLYVATSSGALAWAFPDLPNTVRLRCNYVLLALSAAGALLFARSFFEPRVFAGWIGRAAGWATAALVAGGPLWAAAMPWQPWLLERLYLLAFVPMLLLVPPVLARAWATRSDYLWLFCVAWSAPVLIAALRMGGTLGVVPLSFWLDNSTVVAMTAEALLSSLAVAYRINQLSRDRDRARAGEDAARRLADIDPLTGLLNRRALLAAALGRAGDQVLMLADIDHFKHVNDTIGHDGGDEVLRLAAQALARAAPADALVARMGGEEFAVIVPAASRPDPAALLDALRAERMPFDVAVTASIGVCTGPLGREADWKLLYRGADRALFDAKASGRDRVRHAGPPLAVAA